MEIIVVSDNHGKSEVLNRIRQAFPNASAYIHAGDSEMNPTQLEPFVSVAGNNDYSYPFPEKRIVEVEQIRILVMHSHTLPWGKSVESLVKIAKIEGCQIAIYGHTHRYDAREIDDVFVLNPGSLYYNRDGSKPSFAHILINEDNKLKVSRIFEEDIEKML